MGYTIKNVVSSARVPAWGNQKKYIAVHYLGVDGQGHDINSKGEGAHYYIYWDGTIYQRCSHDAIPWAVGTGGCYAQKHPYARNSNTISIEMCCHNTGGDATSAEDKHWWFTKETQEACAWLVAKLMRELGIPLGNVLRHWDIVNKVCPNPYVYNNKFKTSWTWEEFRDRVKEYYDGNQEKKGVCEVELPVLKRGMKSNYVKNVQRILSVKGYRKSNGGKLPTNGTFGRDTETAVKAFQIKCKVKASVLGQVDAATWKRLLNSK